MAAFYVDSILKFYFNVFFYFKKQLSLSSALLSRMKQRHWTKTLAIIFSVVFQLKHTNISFPSDSMSLICQIEFPLSNSQLQ